MCTMSTLVYTHASYTYIGNKWDYFFNFADISVFVWWVGFHTFFTLLLRVTKKVLKKLVQVEYKCVVCVYLCLLYTYKNIRSLSPLYSLLPFLCSHFLVSTNFLCLLSNKYVRCLLLWALFMPWFRFLFLVETKKSSHVQSKSCSCTTQQIHCSKIIQPKQLCYKPHKII